MQNDSTYAVNLWLAYVPEDQSEYVVTGNWNLPPRQGSELKINGKYIVFNPRYSFYSFLACENGTPIRLPGREERQFATGGKHYSFQALPTVEKLGGAWVSVNTQCKS